MENLRGKKISLRALEPEDLEFLYAAENNEANWEVSNTQAKRKEDFAYFAFGLVWFVFLLYSLFRFK